MKYTNVSYGCQMNVHESEKIAGILEELGYTPAGSIEESDIIVFNTCCIRDTAEKRAFGNIGAVKPIKKKNKDLIVAVVGCMTEQKGYDKIFKEKYPYVDIVLGTGNLNLLKEKIIEKREQGKKTYLTQSCNDPIDETVPQSRTSYPNAWVNIMYGCNNFCTYCIVPYVRGRERSREPEEILKEVRSLVEGGYKEITLLGQNVNSYGNDFSDRPEVNFANLLKAVSEIPGKFRIRFMTSHPKDLTEEVVDVIASSDKIMNNIHLPVQAGSDAVLKKMNRKYDRAHYLALIDMIKTKLPGVGITTDIMVGFPTETEEDFSDTLDLVRKVRYSNAFTFIYSVRKGTAAATMPQIDYQTKRRRITELIALQNEITKQLSEEYIGNVYEVLIEDVNKKYKNAVCGRTESGRLVSCVGDPSLIGTFQNILITEARSASLFGKIVE
ncbi:MAG: tRNA (N6-isopentenyl adenosine(37)-C2)-methylthiotransferase MiaB [Faecalibacterium sp.]|nr:tRNA (N6-isopentenyl adenosine(37)-C2)-methylthiotransferase MiaB [Faecalibacterium sp.]MDY3256230.1 tRNA (N6-isopentenyl adenosine(37)-C2)-methylthiotransferase MiaB [Eubacteriales bacterium]